VTVAMSDHDYGLLVEAVGWIEHHAGADAPEYPHLPSLSGVVDNIAKRQVCGSSKDRRVASTDGGVVVDLRRARRDHAGPPSPSPGCLATPPAPPVGSASTSATTKRSAGT
jgi:hypothetical protein